MCDPDHWRQIYNELLRWVCCCWCVLHNAVTDCKEPHRSIDDIASTQLRNFQALCVLSVTSLLHRRDWLHGASQFNRWHGARLSSITWAVCYASVARIDNSELTMQSMTWCETFKWYMCCLWRVRCIAVTDYMEFYNSIDPVEDKDFEWRSTWNGEVGGLLLAMFVVIPTPWYDWSCAGSRADGPEGDTWKWVQSTVEMSWNDFRSQLR